MRTKAEIRAHHLFVPIIMSPHEANSILNLPVMFTVKSQVARFPLLSFASHVTKVCPMVKLYPDAGSHVTLMASSKLSEGTGGCHDIIAVGWPSSVSWLILAGQDSIVGCSASVLINQKPYYVSCYIETDADLGSV